MGYVKEPKGVDFVIKSEPLTEAARQEISAFIRNYREKKIIKGKSEMSLSKSKASHA